MHVCINVIKYYLYPRSQSFLILSFYAMNISLGLEYGSIVLSEGHCPNWLFLLYRLYGLSIMVMVTITFLRRVPPVHAVVMFPFHCWILDTCTIPFEYVKWNYILFCTVVWTVVVFMDLTKWDRMHIYILCQLLLDNAKYICSVCIWNVCMLITNYV